MSSRRPARPASATTAPRHVPPGPARAGVLRQVAVAAGVAAVAVIAHWRALSAQAVLLDDRQAVLDNPLVQTPGWASARRFLMEITRPSTVSGYYQPLSMISLMADWAAGGRPDNLRPFHRTSLLLHAANTALVVVLLHALLGRLGAAAAAGLLFGVHPFTVEPVVWVAERKTLLAAFFALGSLVAYVQHARRPAWHHWGLCALLYLFAVLAKPTATPLPLLLLLLDWWPLRRLSGRTVVETLPLLVIAVVSAAITVESQRQAAGLGGPAGSNPFQLVLLACHNVVFHLRTLFWPVGLAWHYPYVAPLKLSQPAVAAGVVGTLGLLVVLWLTRRRAPAVTVGGLFFLVAVAPTLGLVGFTYILAAHKFAYLPVVGLLVPLAVLLAWLWDHAGRPAARVPARVAVVLVTLGLAGSAAAITRRDLGQWRTTEGLLRYILAAQPDAHAIRHSLGVLLDEQGRTPEAVAEFAEVVRREPNHWMARHGLGLALIRLQRPTEAVPHLEQAVRLKPDNFASRYNLAQLLHAQGRAADAIPHFLQATRLRPRDADVLMRLGDAYAADKKYEDALKAYDAVLRLRPAEPRAALCRGVALVNLERLDEAEAAYRQALEINPQYAPAREQLDALRKWRAERRTP
ncbi:MAG: tetratricopeptide repeat protein [Planctomycetota bacterium]